MVATNARTAATLGALIYNQVYSLVLVLLHAIRVFLSPRSSPTASCEFYEGRVVHVRRKPLKHRFEYAVRYCLVDLDSAEPPPACCASQLADRLTAAEARALTGCTGRVKLLMLPASAGYAQNPICVYYCYADEGGGGEARLQCCVAQVTGRRGAGRVGGPLRSSAPLRSAASEAPHAPQCARRAGGQHAVGRPRHLRLCAGRRLAAQADARQPAAGPLRPSPPPS